MVGFSLVPAPYDDLSRHIGLQSQKLAAVLRRKSASKPPRGGEMASGRWQRYEKQRQSTGSTRGSGLRLEVVCRSIFSDMVRCRLILHSCCGGPSMLVSQVKIQFHECGSATYCTRGKNLHRSWRHFKVVNMSSMGRETK